MLGVKQCFPAILLLLSSFLAYAQPKDYAKYKADSLAMEAYIDSIPKRLTQPIAIRMADSMFNIAQRLNILPRQALALSYKVDYYYSNRIADSMFMAINEVHKFTKAHNIPLYYYFSWYRIVSYYISKNQINTAINEINIMLDDASKSNYLPAQIYGYTLMARIYYNSKLHNEAYESYKKAIEISKNAPKDVVIHNKYSLYLGCAQVAQTITSIPFDELISLLDTALSYATKPSQKSAIYLNYCIRYNKVGQYDKAEFYLDLAKKTFPIHERVGGLRSLLDAEIQIASNKGDGHRIIILTDSLVNSGIPINKLFHHYTKAYLLIGDYKKAYKYSQKNVKINDSLAISNSRNSVSELIVLTDINRINDDKTRKEFEIKNQKLLYSRILLVAAILILLTISIILKKIIALNRKLKKSEENLTEVMVKLEEKSTANNEFLHLLSHEVRTPLNALIGFSSILIRENPPSEKNNKCEIAIQESSDMIVKFVTDAINITNSSNVKQTVDCDLNSCFDYAMKLSQINIAKNVALKFEPYCGERCIFSINRVKVGQIIHNLIHNAAKFTKQGQITVGVDVDATSKTIIYTVTDTGIGIPPNMHDYVFEYFTKIDSASEGMGLGLPLSRYMAELVGGSLTIDSNYTTGCRFVLRIPY